MAEAVFLWSPVIITVRIFARAQVRIAVRADSLGGSIMAASPRNTQSPVPSCRASASTRSA